MTCRHCGHSAEKHFYNGQCLQRDDEGCFCPCDGLEPKIKTRALKFREIVPPEESGVFERSL